MATNTTPPQASFLLPSAPVLISRKSPAKTSPVPKYEPLKEKEESHDKA